MCDAKACRVCVSIFWSYYRYVRMFELFSPNSGGGRHQRRRHQHHGRTTSTVSYIRIRNKPKNRYESMNGLVTRAFQSI